MSSGGRTESQFQRSLSFLDCLFLGVGGMVGSAIFVFPGSTASLTGPSAILAWICAGLLIGAIALCYVELSLAFPQAGAPAVFPYEAFEGFPRIRSLASYLEGLGYVFGWVFGITVSALALGDYLAVVVPGAGGYTVPLALLAIAAAGSVNYVGVRLTARANLILAALLLATLLCFAAIGLGQLRPAAYRPFFTGGPVSFLAAVQIATTAFGAWTVIPSAIEEIRDPINVVPKTVILSLGIVTLLYAAVLGALHSVVPTGAFTEGSRAMTTPLGVAVEQLGLPSLRVALSLGAVVAIFTTMLVGVLGASRVLFALGENGTLPGIVSTTRDRSGIPSVATGIVTVAAASLALFPSYFYQLLVVASLLGTGLPYAINLASFVGYRRFRPDVTPDFRVPGGYGTPLVAFVGLGVAMVGLGLTEIVWSVAALLCLCGYYAAQVGVRRAL